MAKWTAILYCSFHKQCDDIVISTKTWALSPTSTLSCEHDHEQAASLRKLHADLEKTVEETSKANRRS
eukprot:SAG22_NODE_13833_length_393_cov_1.163265_1_plen_67_part_01